MKKIIKLFNYLAKRTFLIIDILISIEIILISFVNINNLKIKNTLFLISVLYIFIRNFVNNSMKEMIINNNFIKYGNKNFLCFLLNCISLISINFYVYINFSDNYFWMYLLISTLSLILIILNVKNYKHIYKTKKIDYDVKVNLNSLAPKPNYEYYKNSVGALIQGCEDSRNNNIALDGKYGSGKSSIIETFINEIGDEYAYLKVSFAKFNNAKIEQDKLMDQIYQEILIHDIKMPNYFLSGLITSLLFSIFILLNIFKTFIVFDSFTNLLCSICFTSIFYIITIFIVNLKKGKIGIGDSSLELEKNENEIDANKLKLLKLLNKFNKTTIIFIEDLDRFNDITIFQNFRELNFLLNEKLLNRVIFIYALDTSIFDSTEERTKFFDLIIPVIPIGVKSDAMSYFCTEIVEEIEQKLLLVCSSFSNNLRILNNVQNEYILIKKQFLEFNNEYYCKEKNKIFAMVMFKNFYPRQYVELFEYNNFFDEILKDLVNIRYDDELKNTSLFTEQAKMYLSTVNLISKTTLNSKRLSYKDFVTTIDKFVYWQKEVANGIYPRKYTMVKDENEKRKLKDFILELITIGVLDFDYFEYLIPIAFNSKVYKGREKEYFNDLEQRNYIIKNSNKTNLDYNFCDLYDVVRSLPETCFTYNSIHNYNIIHLIFEESFFTTKKECYIKSFLYKVDKDNINLKKLLFKTIDKYMEKNNDPDLTILNYYKEKKEIFELFTMEDDDVIYLSKFIKIMLNNNEYINLKDTYSKSINDNINVKTKVVNNYEDFYEYLNYYFDKYFLERLGKSLNFSRKNLNLNKALVQTELFNDDMSSYENLCYFLDDNASENLNCIEGKLEKILDFLEENKVGIKKYNYKINRLFRNITSCNYDFYENQSILKKLSNYSNYSNFYVSYESKPLINKLKFNDINDITIPIESINILIDCSKLPYSKLWLDYIKEKNHSNELINSRYYKYISDNFDSIFEEGLYKTYFTNEQMNQYIRENVVDVKKIATIYEEFQIDLKNNTDNLKINSLNYAYDCDKKFDKVPIRYLFECTDEVLLNKFNSCSERDYYIEKFKSTDGATSESTSTKYNHFVKIMLQNKDVA